MGSHVVLEAQRVMAGSQCDLARFFTSFWGGSPPLGSCHVVLEAQRVMAESQYDVARSFYLLGDSVPWNSSHVVLEAQRVMAGSQCDMACSFCALFGCFGAFGLVPRRVGGPTRHGGLPIRRGALVLPSFWGIWTLGTRPTSCWRPNASWRVPNAT